MYGSRNFSVPTSYPPESLELPHLKYCLVWHFINYVWLRLRLGLRLHPNPRALLVSPLNYSCCALSTNIRYIQKMTTSPLHCICHF
ncbi:hypothetical protein Fmac_025292 [Flemingia macrophylla]|uniref:Uncharacterized protein n=1 Tax=Flemingia macrophylla TaxID=520843 RepID=A0ABD1LRU4_9FABA